MVSTLALCSKSSAFDPYIAANYQSALSSIFVYELFFLSNSLCCSLVFVDMLQLAKSFGVWLGHISFRLLDKTIYIMLSCSEYVKYSEYNNKL
jgi:hypothetical protein